MAKDCSTCACVSAPVPAAPGRLLLATHVDHTATALRSLARRSGTPLQLLAPGLLQLVSPDVEEFLARARHELTSVEAAEVRCLVTEVAASPDVLSPALLGEAMTAPTLASAGARADNAPLLPLFQDEQACFHAVYQRIVSLDGRRTVGHEALLRAVMPDGTPVFPDQLFPAAEAAGWTNLLDRVGRTTALRDAGSWLGDDLLFINFVPTSIYRPEVCLRTTEVAAREAGVRLDQLVFEVTEGHRVADLDHLEHVFAYYRSRDCKVAIDDLGAGYSSLNTLVRLQPDVVKLDKDIVQSLPGTAAAAVVEAIVRITHAYGGLVLAECVETEEQAVAALGLGVDLGQGWLFGRPRRHGDQPTAVPAAVTATVTASPRVRPERPDGPLAVSALPQVPPGRDLGPEHVVAPGRHLTPEQLARAVAGAAVAVSVVDVQTPGMPTVYVNTTLCRVTGYDAEELIGRNLRMLQGSGTDPDAVRAIAVALAHGDEHRTVVRNYRKDGTAWWNELHLSPVRDVDSVLTHYVGYQLDVTARVEAEQQLRRRTEDDGLTGLANRARLFEHLTATVLRAAGSGRSTGLVLLDLDGFTEVNETHGYTVGDAVLVQVGQRLRAVLRQGDLLARTGGDEFVAVLTDLDPLDAPRVAARVAGDLVAALERPVTTGPVQVRLSGSVGVAVAPAGPTSVDRLLAEADAALASARRQGDGTVRSAAGPYAVLPLD